ncbi:hypothetical protein NE237_026752 [Protea cynaroides]|uniref:Neprosin PEP catalytic domain-containing protein n=1 Tax=Protea cynaroides TaxID=273540 RepID=A0A9Q0JTP6_9MAGN|nr:hypothetical protein NE237_026752 [Protea cynaroides]
MSSLIPKEIPKEISPSGVEHLNLRLQGGGCPSGTVPIRRTTKEDLIRWKSFSNSSGNINVYIPGETRVAGYQLKEPNGRYHGASADLTVHTPRLLTSKQYSGALMWVERGVDIIEFGWHVNPKLYGDNETHIFGYWTADWSLKTGCFNHLCNGFVQVSKSLALGQIFTVPPITEGHMPVVPMFLYQNTYSKNWIIACGEGKMFEAIGYWPPELFNSIKDFAPLVGWRGEVYAPQGELAPEMGTGHFPQNYDAGRQYQSVASFRQI